MLQTFIEDTKGNDDYLVPSLEAIDFQFNRDDIARFKTAFTELGKDFSKENANKLIAPLVKEICGLTVDFAIDGAVNAAVHFPKSIKSHPFYDEIIREYTSDSAQRKTYRKKNDFWIAVDRRNGQIRGTPTKFTHHMVLGAGIFDDDTVKGSKATGVMRAAVIAHEIGHLVGFYEWAHRLTTTNFLLGGFVEELVTATDKKQRLTVIRNVQKDGLLKGIDGELLSAKTADEIKLLVYQSERERSRYDLGTDIYDPRNWEAIADQYVSRMGLQLGLAQAADLFFYGKRRDAYIEMALSYAFAIGITAAAGAVGGVFIPLVGLLAFFGSGQHAFIYDDPKKRVDLIRKETIKRMKVAPDAETKRVLLKEIDAIDVIANKFVDVVGFYQFVGRTFFPVRRGEYRKIAAQKLLEDFSASELNVAAARLEA